MAVADALPVAVAEADAEAEELCASCLPPAWSQRQEEEGPTTNALQRHSHNWYAHSGSCSSSSEQHIQGGLSTPKAALERHTQGYVGGREVVMMQTHRGRS